jgi:hypothetical protein
MIGSLSNQPTAARTPAAPEPASGTSELARAFDRAHHHTGCTDWLQRDSSWVEPSTDGVSRLTEAVRAFVAVGRADGSPPERLLATIKRVTRPCLFDGADAVRGDRLQALVLREFLTAYYDVGAAATLEPAAPE